MAKIQRFSVPVTAIVRAERKTGPRNYGHDISVSVSMFPGDGSVDMNETDVVGVESVLKNTGRPLAVLEQARRNLCEQQEKQERAKRLGELAVKAALELPIGDGPECQSSLTPEQLKRCHNRDMEHYLERHGLTFDFPRGE